MFTYFCALTTCGMTDSSLTWTDLIMAVLAYASVRGHRTKLN